MNNKEAEQILECMAVDMTGALCDTKEPMRDVLQQRIEAINIAQKALRENDMPSEKTLTLEQLRKMDGRAVRVFPKNEYSELGGICVVSVGESDEYSGAYIPGVDHWYWSFDSYNDQWIAYVYPPAHIDREAWKPCSSCKSCDSCKFSVYSVESDGPCFGCENYENYEPQSYCPECGRPLTEEAWDALERRIKGE